MSTRRSLVISFLIFIALTIYGFMLVRGMPDIVPTHWNAAGQVDGYGSKWITPLLMPGIVLFNILMIVALPKLSPRKFEIETFRGTFNYVMLIVTGMEAALGVVIPRATAHPSFQLGPGLIFGVLFLFFALLGNVLGKVRRNFFMGIKTPWTLASEEVWDRTHRSAARLWTVGGFIGCVLSLFNLPFWVLLTGLMAMCLFPVVQSYFIYQKLDRGGQIAGPGA
jgi:uncharacterized membrane protein